MSYEKKGNAEQLLRLKLEVIFTSEERDETPEHSSQREVTFSRHFLNDYNRVASGNLYTWLNALSQTQTSNQFTILYYGRLVTTSTIILNIIGQQNAWDEAVV